MNVNANTRCRHYRETESLRTSMVDILDEEFADHVAVQINKYAGSKTKTARYDLSALLSSSPSPETAKIKATKVFQDLDLFLSNEKPFDQASLG